MPRLVIEFNIDDVVQKAKRAGKNAKKTATVVMLDVLRGLHKEIGKAVERLKRKPKSKKAR